jgi:hypothetical protein
MVKEIGRFLPPFLFLTDHGWTFWNSCCEKIEGTGLGGNMKEEEAGIVWRHGLAI